MRAKLDGQQQLVRTKLANATAADIIAKLQEALSTAESLDTSCAIGSTCRERLLVSMERSANQLPTTGRNTGARTLAHVRDPEICNHRITKTGDESSERQSSTIATPSLSAKHG
jgi:hypothetical protein